ncbi:MAG: DNA repair protein RecO, partial [Gammaproteobacteria bacterium]
ARGAKRAKSALKGILQPFVPLQIEWFAKNELGTLKVAEIDSKPLILTEKYLLSGLYMNELLSRVLTRYDMHTDLFSSYENTLLALFERQNPEPLLRTFELKLLTSLGYGLQLDHVFENGLTVDPEKFYYYRAQHGVISAAQSDQYIHSTQNAQAFLGAHLIAIQLGDFSDQAVLKTAKRVTRLAIASLIGNKPIVSRSLFVTGK